MNYPFWDVGLSYGVIMATVAVLHVFVSHFAIGGGLYLVVSERGARKAGDTRCLEFLGGLSRFFALTSLVLGALTGVGIWFTIGLLNPAATEVLIHNFVWGWAIEWTFFVVEIAAALLYYYGWQRMTPRHHLTVGWIYFVAAWLSLFVINGIITFMLTPGSWLVTGSFWDGFFNPTFWPSLLFRTGVCIMLAGIYSLLTASRYPSDSFKERLVRQNSRWGLAGLLIVAPSFFWYWKAIPPAVIETAHQRMPVPIGAAHLAYGLAAAIAGVLVLFGLGLPRRFHLALGLGTMALGLAWFGSFEWFRESLRKPYIISGYMYGNSLELARAETYRSGGLLAAMKFRTGDPGADLFRRACRSCHTLTGYNPLARAFAGTDPSFIAAAVGLTQRLKGNMPPFWGTPQEASAIADHIYRSVDRRPLATIYGLQGSALGRKVYEIRCALCHEVGGPGDKLPQLRDLGAQDIGSLLDMASQLGDGMPAFNARDDERKAMIEYLTTSASGTQR
jgi:mono/diheme cytochrome c family protein